MLAKASIQLYNHIMSWVYMLSNRPYGALYIGVTNNLSRRVYEHKSKTGSIHTKRYGIDRLVWYESYHDINEAIARETAMKFWHRNWKKRLINEFNPAWRDLYQDLNK